MEKTNTDLMINFVKAAISHAIVTHKYNSMSHGNHRNTSDHDYKVTVTKERKNMEEAERKLLGGVTTEVINLEK